jgi:hypothetical protein
MATGRAIQSCEDLFDAPLGCFHLHDGVFALTRTHGRSRQDLLTDRIKDQHDAWADQKAFRRPKRIGRGVIGKAFDLTDQIIAKVTEQACG